MNSVKSMEFRYLFYLVSLFALFCIGGKKVSTLIETNRRY